jgi:hypothetical protein
MENTPVREKVRYSGSVSCIVCAIQSRRIKWNENDNDDPLNPLVDAHARNMTHKSHLQHDDRGRAWRSHLGLPVRKVKLTDAPSTEMGFNLLHFSESEEQ